MDDPNYAAYSETCSNLNHSTGSRSVKRHFDTSVKTLVYHPSRTRAIPKFNPSTVRQANSLGGIGFIGKILKFLMNIIQNLKDLIELWIWLNMPCIQRY